jgi:lysophospholipase L1-like esterase
MDAGIESLRISSADDVHPNAKGHQIIAAKLARFVSEKRHTAM